MSQTVVVWPLPQKPGSILKPMCVEFLVHEVATGNGVLWLFPFHPIFIISQILHTSLAECPAYWYGCDCRQLCSVPFVTDCCLPPHTICSALFSLTVYNTFSICAASYFLSSTFCTSFITRFLFQFPCCYVQKVPRYFNSLFLVTLCCVLLFLRLGLIFYGSNIFLHLCVSLHFKYLCISFSLDMTTRSSPCTPLLSITLTSQISL